MSPAASRRFRVFLSRSQGYTAEIDAPSAEAAETIAHFLVHAGLWKQIFCLAHEFEDVVDIEPLNSEAGQ